MEILNLKKEIIKKLSELEDGALLNLSNISCSKQILSTLIFRYRGGKKEFHPDFEKYIEKIDFDGIENVLEIGCGDGTLWQKADKKSLEEKRILLTDNSEGMVLDARKHLGDLFEYAVLEINPRVVQVARVNIHFLNPSFDHLQNNA